MRFASSTAARASCTAATPVRARTWWSWPRAPTSCCAWPHVVPGRWTEPPGGLHLSGRQAGEHAAAAGVGRLLLTHIPAWCDPAALHVEAQEAFDGPVEVVVPDAHYDI